MGDLGADPVMVAEERMILEVAELFWRKVRALGWSKVEFAEESGLSRSQVFRLLSGDHNTTLRTLARAAYSMGCKITVTLEVDDG